jgi:hypothetical protein
MSPIYDNIGVKIPHILLPCQGVDLERWAVIACDQFTSQPEYWVQVERMVGEAPSTLHLILPEVYLEHPGLDQRIQRIHENMRGYLDEGVFETHQGLIYVERTIGSQTRKGLVLALDLERYDYHKGSRSLIRATEGTILERIPPRVRIRENAPLELPHILVLIDDPGHTVIEPVGRAKTHLSKRYDFDLMMDSGHLEGYLVDNPGVEVKAMQALEKLADPQAFARRYHLGAGYDVLLFAMGDGNHSLATAKSLWERIKPEVGMDHPARYALVEIENVHDEGLEFEPIHRLLFGLKQDLFSTLASRFELTRTAVETQEEMIALVDGVIKPRQAIGVVNADGYSVVEIANPTSNLPVGTLQTFLDQFLTNGGAERIDYVHGSQVLCTLGAKPGNVGFYVPGMGKNELFKTVILDGALPRKTFSMGEAHEKRFYLECRKISVP